MANNPFEGPFSYEAADCGEDESGALTTCVGTRWFRAPELLYGSDNYGKEIDLWSLGCIFAELLSLKPLFPGTSEIDQLAKIITVLGDLNEESYAGCLQLPDYSKISFSKVENPLGLESCLPNQSAAEVDLVRRLACYDPASRASAAELIDDRYFKEESRVVSELRVPAAKDKHDETSLESWDSDSDGEEFGNMDYVATANGFSIRFC